jgi:hypothetical protein
MSRCLNMTTYQRLGAISLILVYRRMPLEWVNSVWSRCGGCGLDRGRRTAG